jgi:hypothetical protein
MLSAAFAAWREIAALAAATGLSAGVIVGLGALAWFVPQLRALAITTAVAVAAGYGGLLYGNHIGGARVQAEWDAANAKAAAEAVTRDNEIAAKLAADNPPPTPAQQQQTDDDEKKALAAVIAAAGDCVLGSDALKLRKPGN